MTSFNEQYMTSYDTLQTQIDTNSNTAQQDEVSRRRRATLRTQYRTMRRGAGKAPLSQRAPPQRKTCTRPLAVPHATSLPDGCAALREGMAVISSALRSEAALAPPGC